MDNKNRDGILGPPPIDDSEISFKTINPLDIPFKEFTPGQIIQSTQFNDDMNDIEEKVNEISNEHNTVAFKLKDHLTYTNNPHKVTARQTGTYTSKEIDKLVQDVKSGNLNDNAITNRVLDDDCVTARNIEDNTITVSKVDSMLGSQLDISQNIEIATRYTKEETDNLIQDKVGNGTYSKEQLDVKFEEIQAGVIVDSTIGIEKLKEDVGKKLNISGNINILNRYTKDEVDYLIKTNALPHDWGSVLDEVDNDVLPFLDTRNGIFPVADYMIADKFVSPSDQILDFDIREVVESRGEYETLNDRLNVYDTIKPEISVELDAISNKINDNQNINNDEHDILGNKIVENKSKITALNDRMFNLENHVSGHNSKISNVERRADSLESRATALESADRGINVKISNVENRLGSIDTLNNTQTSKINTLENRANTTDTYISNINTNINTVKNDLNNVKSDLNTVKTDLNNVGQIVNENIEPIRTELSQVVSNNNEQDNRLTKVEYINKRQDVMLGGLFNENADGRLRIEGEGNDVKLEQSKDGLVEIESVKGDTLVNLSSIGKAVLYNGGNNKYTTCEMIKPNTTYTSIFNIKSNTLSPGNTSGNVGSIDVNNNGRSTNISLGQTGIIKQVFTTNTDISSYTYIDRIRVYSVTTEGSIEVEVILLEGDYTNKPIPQEYFEGLKSTFEDCQVTQEMVDSGEELEEYLCKYKASVKVVGKNKVGMDLVLGQIRDNNGELVSSTSYVSSKEYYSIQPNTTYIYNSPNISVEKIYFYDCSKSYIGNSYVNSKTKTFTSPVNSKYIRFRFKTGDVSVITSLQLEEGTVATEYEPYKEYVQTLYLDEPLYKDNELCVHDGKLGYWKNWDSVVLDGSDDEKYSITDDYFNIVNVLKGFDDTISSNKIVITKIKSNLNVVSEASIYNLTSYGIGYKTSNSNLRIRIKGVTNLEDFKLFLLQNPISIIYELAEPVFVPILENTPQWLLESFNDCSIHFNTNIPMKSSNLSYTGNVPSVYGMQRTNQIQDDLIDVSLMATDEMFMMLEPLLNAIPETINMKGDSKMVDMYVAMVMRGLKTIEEIPARYREEVKKVLDKLEK